MTQLQFLTPEQVANIPRIQEKWRQVYLNTQPIEEEEAIAAIQTAYRVMGKKGPKEIIFQPSPRAALDYLQPYIQESPQSSPNRGRPTDQPNFFSILIRALWGSLKRWYEQQSAGTKPLYDLLKQLNGSAYKPLSKHIDQTLPKNLSTQDMVEQGFVGFAPLFSQLGKQTSDPVVSKFADLEDESAEPQRQESFNTTASALDLQLGCFPGARFFLRGWMKQSIKSSAIANVSGVSHPNFRDALTTCSPDEWKFLLENPMMIMAEIAYQCTWNDFAFSVLNYPHKDLKWAALENLVQKCGWIFAVKGLCVVCDRPTHISLDDNNQLHAEGESALQFSDGFAIYVHHGTPIPEPYGSVQSDEWQPDWIHDESDIRLQNILVKGIGALRLVQNFPCTEVESLENYRVLKIDGIQGEGQGTYILKYVDPETHEVRAVFTPWHMRTVRQAIRYANEHNSEEQFPMPEA